MKTVIYFFLFQILCCLPMYADLGPMHNVKIESPRYIQVATLYDVFTVVEGSDLLLKARFLPMCFGADLGVVVNGEKVKPVKIDHENFEINLKNITEDMEIVFSAESVAIEGEIEYYEDHQNLGLKYNIADFAYEEVYSWSYYRYKMTDNGWELDYKTVAEPEFSPDMLRNDYEQVFWLWDDYSMSPDTAYYVVMEYFRRYNGEPVIIATVTSPAFTFNDYIMHNTPANKSKVVVSTAKDMIRIQTDSYPRQALIYTISGKLVKNIQIKENETAISVPPGIYIVVVENEVCKVIVE